MDKISLAKLIYKIYNYFASISISYIIAKPLNKHSFTSTNRLVVPRFNTYFMKHSIAHGGSIVWNAVQYDVDKLQSVTSHWKLAKKVDTVHRMRFNALSVQSIPNLRRTLYFIN